jgi:molybdenum cofactor biosynthesis enzyme MoaA
MDMLAGDFALLYTLRMIFKNLPQPSYERYTNLDEVTRNLNKQEYPMGKVWKRMCQYVKIQCQDKGKQVACVQPHHDQFCH